MDSQAVLCGTGGGLWLAACPRWTLSTLFARQAFLCLFAFSVPQAKTLVDLLHPEPAAEKRKHKLKRLVQSPNSFFMDVRCPGCFSM